MLKIATIALLLFSMGCASAPRTGVLAPHCASTAIQEADMQALGFDPRPGRVVIARVFATWCPYCKNDLQEIGARFKSGQWTPGTVQVFLLAYHNRNEDRASFDEFVKKRLSEFDIPADALQLRYVDQTYVELREFRTRSGQKLFDGWQGVPFGLIFGKDGRLAFRGHFTMDDVTQKIHYDFITGLTKENCGG